jgi:GNAT superfamily N-acetyltransferase
LAFLFAEQESSVAMSTLVELCEEGECDKLEKFLVDRIYQFNAQATGFFDARLLGARVRSDDGEVIAALNGYTWGACCVIEHLWVHQSQRGHGLGRALIEAAEAEAGCRNCEQVVLSTHTFQSPAFYERLGYEQQAIIRGQPKGLANIVYAKRIR